MYYFHTDEIWYISTILAIIVFNVTYFIHVEMVYTFESCIFLYSSNMILAKLSVKSFAVNSSHEIVTCNLKCLLRFN